MYLFELHKHKFDENSSTCSSIYQWFSKYIQVYHTIDCRFLANLNFCMSCLHTYMYVHVARLRYLTYSYM